MRVLAIYLVLAVTCGAQSLSTARTSESTGEAGLVARARANMKQYLEDMTERDLVIRETITQFDVAGRVIKVQHRDRKSKGTSLKKREEGYLAPSMTVQADRSFFGSPGPLFFFEVAHAAAVLPIAVTLTSEGLSLKGVDENTGTRSQNENTNAHNVRQIEISYEVREHCPAFDTRREHLHVEYCGTVNVVFDSAGMPLKATFTSANVPMDVNTRKVVSWTFEESFQAVSLPDSSLPLILPRDLKSTYETDKGNIVIENDYALRRAKK